MTNILTTYVNESMASSPSTGTTDTNTAPAWNASGWYTLTTNVNQYTNFYYTGGISTDFEMKVDMQMSSTSGADSCWFFWGWNPSIHALPKTEADTGGYLIERNDFGNTIAIRFNGSILTSTSYTKDTNFDNFRVTMVGTTISVYYLGAQVLTYTDIPRSLEGSDYGWGARCGGTGNTHNIKNLLLKSYTTNKPENEFPYGAVGDGMSRSESWT